MLLRGKMHGTLLTAETQRIVKKHLMHLCNIARQIIDEPTAVLSLGTDHPQHKLVLRHGQYIAVHPC